MKIKRQITIELEAPNEFSELKQLINRAIDSIYRDRDVYTYEECKEMSTKMMEFIDALFHS